MAQDLEKQTQRRESTPLIHITPEPDPSVTSGQDSLWADAKDTVRLGVPIFVAMLSWVGMKTTDSSLLGHVSADALAASSLSDLWTMCTAVLVQGRVLSVLCGAAIGAGNPKLAGIYLQVSYLTLGCILVFVFISWNLTEQVWVAFGSDPEIAHMAGVYAKILAFSLPGQLAFTQLTQFFSSQRIMHPEVNAASIALVMNLVFGLVFVLGIPIPNWSGFGFIACPIVTTVVVYVQLAVISIVYIHIQKLHEPCWDGWSFQEITWGRIRTFCDLYIPAALGMASDFWRVAVVGSVAARLGEQEVAVFNTSYRIMWIVLVLVNAIGSASGIKISLRLGRDDTKGSKQAAEVGVILSAVILAVVGGGVLMNARLFGRIFTNDEAFLDLFQSASFPFTLTLILMNFSVAVERIPYAMGRTKEVFWYGFVASWGFQVPAVFVLTSYWRDDLIGLYSGMAIGYLVLAFLYGFITFTSDWEMYATLARQRSEMH